MRVILLFWNILKHISYHYISNQSWDLLCWVVKSWSLDLDIQCHSLEFLYKQYLALISIQLSFLFGEISSKTNTWPISTVLCIIFKPYIFLILLFYCKIFVYTLPRLNNYIMSCTFPTFLFLAFFTPICHHILNVSMWYGYPTRPLQSSMLLLIQFVVLYIFCIHFNFNLLIPIFHFLFSTSVYKYFV